MCESKTRVLPTHPGGTVVCVFDPEYFTLKAERDALVVQMLELNKLHSDLTNADMVLDDGEHSGYLITSEQIDDMEHYLSEPILCLSARDAEVAKTAFIAGSMHRSKVFFDDETADVNLAADKYVADLLAKAGE